MDAASASTGRPRGEPSPDGVHELVAYNDPLGIDVRADDLQNLQISPLDLL
jgi:hypothetical protein